MLLSDFNYNLPPELIAQQPLPGRDQSRMLVLTRPQGGAATTTIQHTQVGHLPSLLRGDELIVYNDTRVFPARLWAQKPSGGRVELLVLRFRGADEAEAMTRASKPLRPGTTLTLLRTGSTVDVTDVPRNGRALLRFHGGGARQVVHEEGVTPLPPYIQRNPGLDRPEDKERYQTLWASNEGSVAAPTAGLHFSPELLSAIKQRGIGMVPVTLHVGPGTFEPIRTDNVDNHDMETEHYDVPESTAEAVNQALEQGRPVLAIGTTTTRCLESAGAGGRLLAGPGATNLFIKPGYRFRVVSRLFTNFHLPDSTLLVLVSAFAGRERVLDAYNEAVQQRYRFYSYGDCMLIL